MANNLILIFGIILSIMLAALFAGSETGLYQLSRLRLRLGIERKKILFILLSKAMQDAPALLLTMLLGTNLAHYFATSFLTYLLLRTFQDEHSIELLTTLLITPTLFIFSELIPKNLFFYRADSLMPFVSPVLFIFHKFFSWCGIIPVLKFISRLVERLVGWQKPSKALLTAAHQPHINAIFHESHEEGLLSPTQADIIKRMTGFTQLTVKAVVTPLNKTQTIDKNSDKSALLEKLAKSPFARLPVTDGPNIVGFVDIYEPLLSEQPFKSIANFIKPIKEIPADTTVYEAINIMQTENQKIMLVTKAGYGGWAKPLGIITMKDLVEELIGELTEW